jgi:GAF domain-containing protein
MVIEVALEKERLSRQLHAVTEVAKTLASPLELGHLLEAVMGKISGVVETADLGVLMLWDQSAGLFRARASFGWDIQILNEIGLRAGESITGKVFDSGEPLLVNDPEQVAFIMNDMREANQRIMARAIKKKALPTSILAAPLISGSQKFGVLVLETLNGKGGFHPVDLPFVQTIADLVSLAIDRARLVARADAIREAQQAERLRPLR